MLKKCLNIVLLFVATTAGAQVKNTTKLTKIEHALPNKKIESPEKQATNVIFDAALFPFYHGIASGDPTASGIILWTRVSPQTEGDVSVEWQIGTDPQVQNVVQSGTYTTNLNRDYTVKIDVQGLNPGTTYYYKFKALGKESLVGRTRTVPTGSVKQLRFAVVSCSNYQNGYFNAYDRVAERNDIDAVIHLGDYIYEYEKGGYGYTDEVARGHEPANEIITLDDYRVRHSFYKLDESVRKVHQQHPFIVVWDDHEFADDAYLNGAVNHQPESEGNWSTRKEGARKAYFEWMPIRENAQNPNQIYRKIQYGDLLDLLMIDTRMEGREKQIVEGVIFRMQNDPTVANMSENEKNKYILKNVLLDAFQLNQTKTQSPVSQEEFDHIYTTLIEHLEKTNWKTEEMAKSAASKELEEIRNQIYTNIQKVANIDKSAGPKLLGDTQFNWLTQQLSNSRARWKVIGNQVLMMPVIPLNLGDTWNGYTEERTRLYNHILNNNIKNVAVITGDIHMSFAGDLPESYWKYSTFWETGSVGAEFVAPSVTATNLNETVGFTSSFMDWMTAFVNPHIKKTNLSDHGYILLDIQGHKMQADWYYVNDIKQKNKGQWYSHSYSLRNGKRFITAENRPSNLLAKNFPVPAPLEVPKTAFEGKEFTSNLLVIGNYPNPSQNVTNLHFGILKTANVTVTLYNEKGDRLENIFDQKLEEGLYNLEYQMGAMEDGLYVLKISDENQVITKKILIRH